MKIIPRVYESGRRAWQVLLPRVKGKRKQPCFSTREKAEIFMAAEKVKLKSHGGMGGDIRGAEMAEIVVARKRLEDVGATLSEAVEFYLKHATRLREEITVPELIERFWESRERMKKSVRYVRQLKVSLGTLGLLFPLTKAHELTQDDVEAWLGAHSHSWGPVTRDNYLGDVSAMYEWGRGKTRGYARINPAKDVERVNARRGQIVALDVERATELLSEAAEQKRWRVLAHVVFGMLGGIRPAEIERLNWNAVDLDERHVIVMAEDAKTAARRVVDLTAEAVAWLRLIPVECRVGMITPKKGWVDEWIVFRRELGWDVGRKGSKHLPPPVAKMVHGRWPHDALRHTYASMHYAEHQNEALLQVQMGHRSAKMIHQHYRAVKTRAEAALFWRFGPLGVAT